MNKQLWEIKYWVAVQGHTDENYRTLVFARNEKQAERIGRRKIRRLNLYRHGDYAMNHWFMYKLESVKLSMEQ